MIVARVRIVYLSQMRKPSVGMRLWVCAVLAALASSGCGEDPAEGDETAAADVDASPDTGAPDAVADASADIDLAEDAASDTAAMTDDSAHGEDSGPAPDTLVADTVTEDTGPIEDTAVDTTAEDTSAVVDTVAAGDTGVADTVAEDTSPALDTVVEDTVVVDAAEDTSPVDTVVEDTVAADTTTEDTSPAVDTVVEDTVVADTTTEDTSPAVDTMVADTVVADTTTEDTSPAVDTVVGEDTVVTDTTSLPDTYLPDTTQSSGCLAFTAGACPDGEWCKPTERDAQTGLLVGDCVAGAGGTAEHGDPCQVAADCEDGAVCLGLSSGKVCLSLCDPEAELDDVGICPAHSRCSGLVSGGEPLPYGACVPGCIPYVDVAESGCDPASEWCVPDGDVPGDGQCFSSTGTTTEGGVCGVDVDGSGSLEPDERCEAGLFCLSGLASSPRCVLPCDPAAAPSEAGHCSNVSGYPVCSCLQMTSGGVPLAFGAVLEGCDYLHGGPRVECEHWGSCAAGELSSADGQDRCVMDLPDLGPHESCTAAGLGSLDQCAPFGVCVDTGADVICRYYCAASAGTIGEAGHPDCGDDALVCYPVAGRDDLGVCAPPI